MFTWICPQCGREVPPSFSECPSCAENRQRATQAPAPAPQPPPPAYAQPGPQAYPPQTADPRETYHQPTYPQPTYAPPPPQGAPVYSIGAEPQAKSGLPGWIVVILVFVGIAALIFRAVKLFGHKDASTPPPASATAPAMSAGTPGGHPFAKFIEVTGLRITEDAKQRATANFVIVNHSSAELPDVELRVNVTTSQAKESDDPIATVVVKAGTLPASGIREISVPLETKLRAYEMPDWQFLRATYVITAPK